MNELMTKYKMRKEYDKILTIIFQYCDLETAVSLSRVNRLLRGLYHELDFRFLLEHMIKAKWKLRKILEAYISYYEYLPKQGTEQWLKLRIHTIGGSEMATVLGQNKYQTLKDFVGGKLGIDKYKFSGNIATRWGKVFEPVFRLFVERLFSNTIYETGSIPGYKNTEGIVLQSYSPDGLGICDIARVKKMIDICSDKYFGISSSEEPEFHNIYESFKRKYGNSRNPDDRRMVVLFEFKCPLYSEPDGSVPAHYISQPLTGLCTIPITTMALFMQGLYRKCSAADFILNDSIDTTFHRPLGGGKGKQLLPKVMGFVGFYHKTPNTRSIEKVKNNCCVETITEEEKEYIISEFWLEVARPHSRFANLVVEDREAVKVAKLLRYIEPDESAEKLWLVGSALGLNTRVKRFFVDSIWIPPIQIDFSQLSVGRDYGESMVKEFFESFMETLVDDRKSDMEIYYPEGMFHRSDDDELNKYFDQDIPANYVSKTNSNPQQWLFDNLKDFEQFCNTGGYEPVGFMPWKMFDYTCLPVYKDPDFVTKNMPKIEAAHKVISEIRSTSTNGNYHQELERRFPSRGGGGGGVVNANGVNVGFTGGNGLSKGSGFVSFKRLPPKTSQTQVQSISQNTPQPQQHVEYDNMEEFFNM